MGAGGNDPRLKTYARRLLRKAKAAGHPPCALCGGPIAYDAPRWHPLSYDLDEILPRAFGGDPLDPANVRPTHAHCNRSKGRAVQVAIQQSTRTVTQSPRW